MQKPEARGKASVPAGDLCLLQVCKVYYFTKQQASTKEKAVTIYFEKMINHLILEEI